VFTSLTVQKIEFLGVTLVKTRFLRPTSASFDVGIDSSPLDRGGRGGGKEWGSTAKVLHSAPQVPCIVRCSPARAIAICRGDQPPLLSQQHPQLTFVLLCVCDVFLRPGSGLLCCRCPLRTLCSGCPPLFVLLRPLHLHHFGAAPAPHGHPRPAKVKTSPGHAQHVEAPSV